MSFIQLLIKYTMFKILSCCYRKRTKDYIFIKDGLSYYSIRIKSKIKNCKYRLLSRLLGFKFFKKDVYSFEKLDKEIIAKLLYWKTYPIKSIFNFIEEIRTSLQLKRICDILKIEDVFPIYYYKNGETVTINGKENAGITIANSNSENRVIKFYNEYFKSIYEYRVFSTMHELAHIILKHSSERYDARATASNLGYNENECDTLALIMMKLAGYKKEANFIEKYYIHVNNSCYSNPYSKEYIMESLVSFYSDLNDMVVPSFKNTRVVEFNNIVDELIPHYFKYITWK